MADGEIKAIVTADIAPFEAKLRQAKILAGRFYKEVSKPVKIDADITQFRNKINAARRLATNFKKGIRKAAKFDISTTSARTSISQISSDVERLKKNIRSAVNIEVNIAGFRTQLRKVREIGDRFVKQYRPKLELQLDLQSFREQLRQVRTEAEGLRRNVNEATGAPAAANGNQQAAQSADRLSQAQERVSQSANRQTDALNNASTAAQRNQRANQQAAQATKRFDNFVGGLADSAALVTGPLGGIASRINVLGRAVSGGTVAIVGFGVAVTGLGIVLNKGAREAEKFQTSQLRLEAQVRATGQAAGVTADEIVDFSNKLGLATLGDPLEIQQVAARLLAFRGLSREVFFDVLTSAQDLAELGFGNLNTAAIALATAATEPERGLSRLERQNIRLSPAIKDTIIALSQQGARLRAQKILLEEVQKATGGVAKSVSVGLSGAFDTANQRISEFFKTVGEESGALDGATNLVNKFAESLDALTQTISNIEPLSGRADYDDLLQKRQQLVDRLKSDTAKNDAEILRNLQANVAEIDDVLDEKYSELVARQRKLQEQVSNSQLRSNSVLRRKQIESLQKVQEELRKYAKEYTQLRNQETGLQELIKRRDELRAQFGAGEGDTTKIEEQLKLLDGQIAAAEKRLEVLQEQNKAEEAAARAASDRAQAELDAQNAAEKARQQALAEQNRLESIRRVSLRSLKEQNDILQRINALEGVNALSARQYAEEKERISREVRLGLTDSKETAAVLQKQLDVALKIGSAAEINSLTQRLAAAKAKEELTERVALNRKLIDIERERAALTAQREQDVEELQSVEAQIRAQEELLRVAYASEEAKKEAQKQTEVDIRLQERLAELAKENIELSRAQIEAERASIATLVERESQLEKLQDANEKIEEQQKEALENQKKFQETVASGFADMLFEVDNFEDAIKRLILQLSKAAVEARVLAAIQYATGTGDGTIDGGSTSGGIAQILGSIGKSVFGSFLGGSSPYNASGDPAAGVIESPYVGVPVAHQGGIVGRMPSLRTVAANEFIDAPRYHNGLRQNEVPAILERGEEVVPKDQVGRRDRGDTTINFNVTTPDANSFRMSQRQLSNRAKRAVMK